jgi:IclR helix-turn-helix domain
VASWSFLTNHARVLLCIARDPGMRLRDLAASLGITERSAHGIVTDLAEAGYVLKHKDGRRNRYQIQAHLPLPEPTSQEPAIGEVLALLAGAGAALHSGPDQRSRPHGSAGGPPLRPAGLAGAAVNAAAPHERIRHQQASGQEAS